MFVTGGQRTGVSLIPCPEFCGLEGTRTFAIKFDKVFVSHEDVIAEPEQFADYIQSIKAGFILLQIGIGAGIVDGCLAEIAASNAGSETNDFLDNGYEELNGRFQTALNKTAELADAAYRNEPELLETLRLREAAAVLCLDAAQSAALHTGAAGYLMQSPVQRRVRESSPPPSNTCARKSASWNLWAKASFRFNAAARAATICVGRTGRFQTACFVLCEIGK